MNLGIKFKKKIIACIFAIILTNANKKIIAKYWQSFVPLKYKINLVRNLLHRAYKICNSYSLIHEDFKIISTMLEKNGYPTGFLNQQIRIFFNKMHEKVKTPEVEEKSDPESKTRPIFLILKLPYIGNMCSNQPRLPLQLATAPIPLLIII